MPDFPASLCRIRINIVHLHRGIRRIVCVGYGVVYLDEPLWIAEVQGEQTVLVGSVCWQRQHLLVCFLGRSYTGKKIKDYENCCEQAAISGMVYVVQLLQIE